MTALDTGQVKAALPDHDIRWLQTVDSTMTVAAGLAARGAPSRTVIGAEEQTAGQGRYGRHWYSEPFSGLYFTEILRLGLPAGSLPVVTLALGLAAADAIAQTCGVPCDLRWPNDVLIAGRKCAGILTQLHDDAVVAGIGINVNHGALPPELAPIATSIRIQSGRTHSREELLIATLRSIDVHCDVLSNRGRSAILSMFTESSSFVRGRRVYVDQGGSTAEGVTEGLDQNGFLLLRRNDGRRETILAGGVRPAG